MKIYLVGGAVRDKLLGLPIKEKDYVVIGATVNDMLQLGYKQVGKEFPVFLHPKTREEYALARKERKISAGYTGFTFDSAATVRLEEDLQRRDLTINAMAEDDEGNLIDPYHGYRDLKQKVLRHISPAFAEDPVRILRVARLLARFHHLGFSIAPETYELMRTMVASGEVNALVAERVWKELERALQEPDPEYFFIALSKSHALAVLFPTITIDGAGFKALCAAKMISPLATVRLASLLHDQTLEAITSFTKRYRIPSSFKELIRLVNQYESLALNIHTANAESLLHLFMKVDAFRRYERFILFLYAVAAIAQIHNQRFHLKWLAACADVTRRIDVKPLIKQGYSGQVLSQKLRALRLQSIEHWMGNG